MHGSMPASSVSHSVQQQRTRRLALGGTFLVAVALAVQLGQTGPLSDDNLVITGPVVFLGAILSGWVLRPSAAISMGLAAMAALCTFGVFQAGSAYTDEMLLFAVPFSGMAAVVVGHCRRWPGTTALLTAIVLIAFAIGIGMTEYPVPFVILHLALVVSLPTVPLPSDPVPSERLPGSN